MKKALILTLSIILLLPTILCGCGSNNNTLTVTFEDGTTKEMTVSDIEELSKTDGRRYNQIEWVEGSGKVTGSTGRTERGSASLNGPANFWSIGTVVNNQVIVEFYYGEEIADMWEMPPEEYQFYNGDNIEFYGDFRGFENDKIVVGIHVEGTYVRLK